MAWLVLCGGLRLLCSLVAGIGVGTVAVGVLVGAPFGWRYSSGVDDIGGVFCWGLVVVWGCVFVFRFVEVV